VSPAPIEALEGGQRGTDDGLVARRQEGGGQRSTTSHGGRNSVVRVPLKYASSHANIF
jgi:hypothetical protein